MLKRFFLLFFLIQCTLEASGINGIIKDNKSDEPLVNATVYLEGTKIGTKTNKKGYYSIQGIKKGKYTVRITYLGYATYREEIVIDNKDIRLDVSLEPEAIKTEAVEVVSNREVLQREIKISSVNVPVSQIKDIRIGGESDVFRTLQFLPGVLTSSQISSGLFVRGGSPDQNLVLLDGNTVYNPSHLFGFFSTFNTNAIKDVEFIKGGFEAEYGGRLASVLTITQKDGNKNDYHGSLSLGLISSQANFEGPLGNGSFFISGRRTYLDFILSIIPQDEKNPFPSFYFYDLNAKIVQDIGENDKISIIGFLGRDVLSQKSNSSAINMNTGNSLVAASWSHIFSNNLFSDFNVHYSEYKNNFNGGESSYEMKMDNKIKDLSAKYNVELFIKNNASAKFGFEVSKLNFDYLLNFTGDTDTTINEGHLSSTNLTIPDMNYALFSQTKFNITEKLSTQAGIRANYFQLNNSLKIDPRLALRYMLKENIWLKAAWGIYHQNLRIATLQTFNIIDTWLPSDTTVPISKANHYIFSIETQPANNLNLNFDFYYKTMNNIGELNMFTLKSSVVSDVLFIGNAKSYGAEVFLQKSIGKLTGWLGYAFSFVEMNFDSINGGRTFNPKYDRRHDFKIVAQYAFNKNWNIGASFTLQSGQPYTGYQSRGKLFLPGMNYGTNKLTSSERYGLRLPASHQLNLSATYNFKFFKQDANLTLDIFNIYNRRDILMRVYNMYEKENQTIVEDFRLLPIIPTLSFEIKF